MAKEIEVKILEIDPKKVRDTIKSKGAKLVMPKNKQINLFYAYKDSQKAGTIRLRKNILGYTLTFKSKLKFNKGHKIMDEFETKIEDFDTVKKGLECLKFKLVGGTEAIREDWKLYNCLVSIVRLPKIPTYVEIEGTKKNILRVAKMLGYTEKDYYPTMIYKKYGIKTKFLKF